MLRLASKRLLQQLAAAGAPAVAVQAGVAAPALLLAVRGAKTTTGIVGLPLVPDARNVLKEQLQAVLDAIQVIPADAEYRRSVEKTVRWKLAAVESDAPDEQVEELLGRQLEQDIKMCKEELGLIPKMAEWKPWDVPADYKVEMLTEQQIEGKVGAGAPAPNHSGDLPRPATVVWRATMSLGAASAVEVGTLGQKSAGRASEMPSSDGRPPPRPAAAAAAAPPPRVGALPPALRRKAAYQACSFDRKLALFSLFFHGSTQVVSLLAWHTLPASERLQRVGSIVYALGPLLIPMLFPEWYIHGNHRSWLLAVYRVGFFSFPLLRQPRGIQKVLGGAAQPGARGVLKDLLRLIWGTRLVAVMCSAAMVPLSILGVVPQLALLLYAVAMVRANPSLCSSALTAHPLTQQRIRGLHDLLHLAGMLLPGGIGQATSPLHVHRDEVDCESFLSFLFILVGVVLPLAVLVKTEPPASLKAWEERRQRASSGSAGGGSGGSSGSAGSRKPRSLWRGACAAVGRASLLLETGVRELCGRSWTAPAQQSSAGSAAPGQRLARQPSADLELRWSLAGWQRGMAWWLLVTLIWGVCRLHHGLRVA